MLQAGFQEALSNPLTQRHRANTTIFSVLSAEVRLEAEAWNLGNLGDIFPESI